MNLGNLPKTFFCGILQWLITTGYKTIKLKKLTVFLRDGCEGVGGGGSIEVKCSRFKREGSCTIEQVQTRERTGSNFWTFFDNVIIMRVCSSIYDLLH